MKEFDCLFNLVVFFTEVNGGHFVNLDPPTQWVVVNTGMELNFSFPAIFMWNPARFQPQTTKVENLKGFL